MFGFFKKKNSLSANNQTTEMIARFAKPIAYASALISLADDYPSEIKRRDFSYPIYQCKSVSIVEMWNYMTVEACLNTVRFGISGVIDLADFTFQEKILHSFLEKKSHLQYPQPSGSKEDQAIQAMWQSYIYLSQAGTSVCDILTDKYVLSSQGKSIISDIELVAGKMQSDWLRIKAGEYSVDLPETLFEAFYKDWKLKTKNIALSRFFGPNITTGMKDFEHSIEEKSGHDMAIKQAKVHKVLLDAETPDEATKIIHKIFNS